jgi:hypothetical protein
VAAILAYKDAGGRLLKNVMKYRDTSGQHINFDPIAPFDCAVCGREHEREMPHGYIANDGAVLLFCRRSGDKIATVLGAKLTAREWLTRALECDLSQPYRAQMKRVKTVVYNERWCRDYPAGYTSYYIKSQLGTGKTYACDKFLRALDPANCIAITPRVSLARACRARLKANGCGDYTLYLESGTRVIVADQVVCQLDSLSRIGRDYDVVVLDEIESILIQTQSSQIVEHVRIDIVNRLISLIRNASVLICSDGHLQSSTIEYIDKIRSDALPMVMCNERKAYVDYTAVISAKISEWEHAIATALCVGKRIVIATNSRSYAVELRDKIRSKNTNLSIGLYTSRLEETERIRIFDNIHEEFSKHDVIIYTSTISSGVSFEAEHFDSIFAHYFAGVGTVCEGIQMLHRVRTLGDCTVNIFINTSQSIHSMLPLTVEKLRERAFDRKLRQEMLRVYVDDREMISLIQAVSSEYGLEFHAKTTGRSFDDSSLRLTERIIIERNNEIKNYTCLFISHLLQEGMSLTLSPELINASPNLAHTNKRTCDELALLVRDVVLPSTEDYIKSVHSQSDVSCAAFAMRQNYGLYVDASMTHIGNKMYYTGAPLDLNRLTLSNVKLLMKTTSVNIWNRWHLIKGKNVKYVADGARIKANNVIDTIIANTQLRQSLAVYYVQLFGVVRIDDTNLNARIDANKLAAILTKVRTRLGKTVNGEKVVSRELEIMQLNAGASPYLCDVSSWDDRKLITYIKKHLNEYCLTLQTKRVPAQLYINDVITVITDLTANVG